MPDLRVVCARGDDELGNARMLFARHTAAIDDARVDATVDATNTRPR